MRHPMREMIERRKQGYICGIPSYCSANELVLEVALQRAKASNRPVLIEATANQVNQYGGYTGMKPKDFYQLVMNMAEKIDVQKNLVILAGDHLGPLTWQNFPELEAMKKSEELVYQYTRAGFSKIHLDTSMKVADDGEGALSTEIIARRGAKLYKAAMKGYEDLKSEKADAIRPVFVIGSEVPIPGGTQEKEEGLAVTSASAFRDTVFTYQRVWKEEGIGDGIKDVIAVVVQPGVEFGDNQVFYYSHDAAKELCDALKEYPELCFEGHSTDYQSAECLKEMVQDGIAILKVGPALTYGLREALFSLSLIEKELVREEKQSHFMEMLEKEMLESPENWQKHYHGDEKQLHLARKYSFSDRSRYYISQPELVKAMNILFENLDCCQIPLNMLHQYMPLAYAKIVRGNLELKAKELAMDGVMNFMAAYEYATMCDEL